MNTQLASSPMSPASENESTKPSSSSAAAVVNHLSCWRSTPCERRKRTIIEATAAGADAAQSPNPTQLTKPGIHETPNGLSTHG